MANKRMFSKKITESDAFMDMPATSQLLYFHLNMNGDDDGFVGNPKTIMRTVGAKDDDLKMLIAKRFVIFFESGVCVIKHWLIHNTLKNDRYIKTVYLDEKKELTVKDNKSYTECFQNVSKLEPQHNITKHNITEHNKDYCPADIILIKDIIKDLNEVLKTSYKSNTKKTRDLINARLNEGFGIEDFKIVHRKKAYEWGADKKMVKYLRPETLYSNKFEGYLNQKESQTSRSEKGVEAVKTLNKWANKDIKEVENVGQRSIC